MPPRLQGLGSPRRLHRVSAKHRFAARGKRNRLAAPFVTTVLLGAAACAGNTGTDQTTPATKTKPAGTSKTDPTLVPPIPNDPKAKGKPTTGAVQGGAGGQGTGDKWRNDPSLPRASGYVTYNRDGTCMGTVKTICPTAPAGKPQPTCNPPAPRAVQCPPTPSPAEIADARKQTLDIITACARGNTLPANISIEINSSGKCENVVTLGKLDKKIVDCATAKLKKLGWPLNTDPYQIEVK